MLLKTCVTVGLMLALPVAVFAQSTDADYCKKLGTVARIYGANTGPVPEATAKCDSDPKSSIAILEKHLLAEKINLPPR